ncbi:MAG: hypothetical protein M0036_23055 [Desulfobacteraceae bacterium]|nr:hypothetical protein [Desulfobacteraceae bacterium]
MAKAKGSQKLELEIATEELVEIQESAKVLFSSLPSLQQFFWGLLFLLLYFEVGHGAPHEDIERQNREAIYSGELFLMNLYPFIPHYTPLFAKLGILPNNLL